MWWYYSTVFRIHCCYWEVCFIPVAIPLWMKSYFCKFLSSSFCFGCSEALLPHGYAWVSFVYKAGIPEICVLKTLLRVCCMPKFENPCYTSLKVYHAGSPAIWGRYTGKTVEKQRMMPKELQLIQPLAVWCSHLKFSMYLWKDIWLWEVCSVVCIYMCVCF